MLTRIEGMASFWRWRVLADDQTSGDSKADESKASERRKIAAERLLTVAGASEELGGEGGGREIYYLKLAEGPALPCHASPVFFPMDPWRQQQQLTQKKHNGDRLRGKCAGRRRAERSPLVVSGTASRHEVAFGNWARFKDLRRVGLR